MRKKNLDTAVKKFMRLMKDEWWRCEIMLTITGGTKTWLLEVCKITNEFTDSIEVRMQCA
jgi:hypothetical protein